MPPKQALGLGFRWPASPHMGLTHGPHWGWVVRLALGQPTALSSHVGPILLWAPLLDPSRTF